MIGTIDTAHCDTLITGLCKGALHGLALHNNNSGETMFFHFNQRVSGTPLLSIIRFGFSTARSPRSVRA